MRSLRLWLFLAAGGLLFVLAGVILITFGRTIGQYWFGRDFAEDQLRDYVTQVLNQEVNGASCQRFDTNKNGYVSCDYTTTSNPTTPRSIECAAWGLDGFFNRGCKARIPSERY